MSGGVFAITRGLIDHPIFKEEPYTEPLAFIWLVGEASWKDRRVRVGRAVVDLKRGQCAFALRFMASKWGWSEASVRRFLNKLKSDAMIDAQSDAQVTRITICNYDKYQKVSLPDDAQSDAPDDANMTHKRRKEESREIQDNKIAAIAAVVPSSPEVELFERGKALLGKDAGGLINRLLKAKDGNVALARAAIETASTKQNPREYVAACCKTRADGQPQTSFTRWAI